MADARSHMLHFSRNRMAVVLVIAAAAATVLVRYPLISKAPQSWLSMHYARCPCHRPNRIRPMRKSGERHLSTGLHDHHCCSLAVRVAQRAPVMRLGIVSRCRFSVMARP